MRTVEQRLLAARVALDNTRSDPVILAAMAGFGYDETRLSEGETLLTQGEALHQQQKREYGEQYDATGALKVAFEAANKVYTTSLKIARLVFKSDLKAQGALALNGLRRSTISGWIGQSTQFYANLLADEAMMAAMGGFGYTVEKLQAEQALVADVETAHVVQARETGEAQAATQARDAKMDALDTWMGTFFTVAKAALEENAQLLEKIGLVVAS